MDDQIQSNHVKWKERPVVDH